MFIAPTFSPTVVGEMRTGTVTLDVPTGTVMSLTDTTAAWVLQAAANKPKVAKSFIFISVSPQGAIKDCVRNFQRLLRA
jgi:hypothetical protein